MKYAIEILEEQKELISEELQWCEGIELKESQKKLKETTDALQLLITTNAIQETINERN